MTPEELQAHFRERLSLRIQNLESIFSTGWDTIHEDQLEPLTNFLHKLSGAAGLYGFNQLSQEAKTAERIALLMRESQTIESSTVRQDPLKQTQITLSKHLKEIHQMMLSEHRAL